jgi:hypothetical protein
MTGRPPKPARFKGAAVTEIAEFDDHLTTNRLETFGRRWRSLETATDPKAQRLRGFPRFSPSFRGLLIRPGIISHGKGSGFESPHLHHRKRPIPLGFRRFVFAHDEAGRAYGN